MAHWSQNLAGITNVPLCFHVIYPSFISGYSASPCGPLYLVTQLHSQWPAAHLGLWAVPSATTRCYIFMAPSSRFSSFSRRVSWGALPWTSAVLSVGGLGCTKYSPEEPLEAVGPCWNITGSESSPGFWVFKCQLNQSWGCMICLPWMVFLLSINRGGGLSGYILRET